MLTGGQKGSTLPLDGVSRRVRNSRSTCMLVYCRKRRKSTPTRNRPARVKYKLTKVEKM